MRKFLPIFVFIVSVLRLSAATIYVNTSASGSNDGTSWANAYTALQTALDAAVSGDQIWVAKGTYKPTQEEDVTTDEVLKYTFKMVDRVEIYGGFAGNETDVSQRSDYGDGGANETILSGDLNGDDNFDVTSPDGYLNNTGDDNCYHVVYNIGVITSNAVLDGFTISGGHASDDTNIYNSLGAGMIFIGC